jgi:hypothetical protein
MKRKLEFLAEVKNNLQPVKHNTGKCWQSFHKPLVPIAVFEGSVQEFGIQGWSGNLKKITQNIR